MQFLIEAIIVFAILTYLVHRLRLFAGGSPRTLLRRSKTSRVDLVDPLVLRGAQLFIEAARLTYSMRSDDHEFERQRSRAEVAALMDQAYPLLARGSLDAARIAIAIARGRTEDNLFVILDEERFAREHQRQR